MLTFHNISQHFSGTHLLVIPVPPLDFGVPIWIPCPWREALRTKAAAASISTEPRESVNLPVKNSLDADQSGLSPPS
jgi:hypothetical protein